MANEVYIQLKTAATVDGGTGASKYPIDLSPVDTIDDTYKNQQDVLINSVFPEENPSTFVTNTKMITHTFVFSGLMALNDGDAVNGVTKIFPDQSSAEGMQDPDSKLGRMRILMGFGKIEDATVEFYINDNYYSGFITRFSNYPKAGVTNKMDFILEIIEGEAYY